MISSNKRVIAKKSLLVLVIHFMNRQFFYYRQVTVPDAYVSDLKINNIITDEDTGKILNDHNTLLNDHFKKVDTYEPNLQFC